MIIIIIIKQKCSGLLAGMITEREEETKTKKKTKQNMAVSLSLFGFELPVKDK